MLSYADCDSQAEVALCEHFIAFPRATSYAPPACFIYFSSQLRISHRSTSCWLLRDTYLCWLFQVTYHEQFATISREFSRQSAFLFSFLSNISSPQASPHLGQLLLRLDFNRFLVGQASISWFIGCSTSRHGIKCSGRLQFAWGGKNINQNIIVSDEVVINQDREKPWQVMESVLHDLSWCRN